MIRFNCDYGEGAHPRILERLSQTNYTQTPGYGEDEFCREAADIIRGLIEAPNADVHFLTGGTQANLTVLAAALKPHQGVLSAETGHIASHETGAVEATGHKVLALPHRDGKISAGQIDEYCRLHFADDAHEHIVMPGAVYLSNPTELGTIYSRRELQALREACDRWNLMLYVDGARLGYGLSAPGNDLTLPFLAAVADAFTIGGTKVGLLFGEAVVLTSPLLKRDFRYIVKQKGGMLAKGRLLGIQFSEILRDGLYFELSQRAVGLALRLKEALAECGHRFLVDSPTNQQFPILPDALLAELGNTYTYSYQMRVDETRSAVRFCTSWATSEEDVEKLIGDIRRGSHG